MKATRDEVYAAIDSERAYQQFRSEQNGTLISEERPHSAEEFALYMKDYLDEAMHILARVWTSDRSAPPDAVAAIRKVTALGVACMEQHGAPQRSGFEYKLSFVPTDWTDPLPYREFVGKKQLGL